MRLDQVHRIHLHSEIKIIPGCNVRFSDENETQPSPPSKKVAKIAHEIAFLASQIAVKTVNLDELILPL